MRARPTTAVLAAALALGGAPAAASAKGIAGAELCGAGACHAVATPAVRAAFERFTPARAPSRAEPFLTLRVRARVSSGRIAVVATSAWLPRANLVRAAGERAWTRPAPVLTRAMRRAARGLRAHAAAGLGDVSDAPPAAHVVEVFAPADAAPRGGGSGEPAALAAVAALLAAAAALAWRGRAAERRTATLPTARS
jgi:hypothetical protein